MHALPASLENPSFHDTIPIDVTYGTQVDSPWGDKDAYLIYSVKSDAAAKKRAAESSYEVDVYCVDCGITGSATISGALSYQLLPPAITKAEVALTGSLNAGVNIGLYATAQYSNTWTKNLITLPVPDAGVTVSDLLTIGVVVTVDATAEVDISATGQILVGADLSIPDFDATLELVGGGSHMTGFTPQLTKVFNASGEITASVSLALPVEIGLAFDVPPLSIKHEVGLTNTPTLTATADFEFNTDTTAQAADGCPNGLYYDVSFTDAITFGLDSSTTNLYTYSKDGIFTGCFQLPVGQNTNTSTTTTTLPSISPSPTVITVVPSVSPSPAPASSSVPSASASSLPWGAVAPDSPASTGTTAWGEYANVDWKASTSSLNGTGMNDSSCALACKGTQGCVVSSVIGANSACYLGFGQIFLLESSINSVTITQSSCAGLQSGVGAGFTCLQYFPAPTYALAADSPTSSGTTEWAEYPGADWQASSWQYYGTNMDNVQCALACQSTSGCVVSSLWIPTSNCYIGFGTIDLLVGTTEYTTVAQATCASLADGVGKGYTCDRLYPAATSPYVVASDSPSQTGSVEYAEFYNTDTAGNQWENAPGNPTSAAACVAACVAFENCVATTWSPKYNGCYMAIGSVGELVTGPDAGMETVFLSTCAQVTQGGE
jgi:hypothetical protein